MTGPNPAVTKGEIRSKSRLKDLANSNKMLFNLKITDLTTSDNPFVFFENQQVDDEGYLLFVNNQETL